MLFGFPLPVKSHRLDRHSLLVNFYLRGRLRRELQACQATLTDLLGRPARFYRPPVGLRNPATHRACDELELQVVGWQVRSLDRSRRDPGQVAERVLRRVRPGGIVLLHDGGQEPGRAVEITEAVLRGLEERGLKAVGLSRLLQRA